LLTGLLMLGVSTPALGQAASPSDLNSPRVSALLDKMSVEEKLGQLVQTPGGRSKSLNSKLGEAEFARIRRGGVGSYLHVAGAEPLRELQRVAVEEGPHGIPLLFAMDVVHGYRTIFPVPLAMASSFDPALWQQASRVSAQEAAASGLHWTFAPMVDIARDPRWGRIVEGAGSDAYLGSRMAVAQVRGYQGKSLDDPTTILAGTKHFGAYGAAEGGRDYGPADISERSLRELYLAPFHAAADAGSATFMTAFNDVGGAPTTGNEALVDGILRNDWGWDGLIVSDWNAVAELINHGVAEDRTAAGAMALRAGVDMDMSSAVFGEDLYAGVANDPARLADLDLAVARVLRTKEALGLFDDPYAYHDVAREESEILADDHRALAKQAAERSVVLLKNEGMLPLAAEAGQRIAVIGELADDAMTQLGSWRAQGKSEDVTTLLDGLRAGAPDGVDVSYASGAGGEAQIRAAAQLAKASDHVLLVIGEDFDLSGEARSRSAVELPEQQAALAEAVMATGARVTVLLVTGRPMAVPELDAGADAVLLTWMLGLEAGPAVADVVFGRSNPAGRLPVSFPRRTGQTPLSYDALPTGRPADPDPERDTNRYLDLPITPLYPFGHGLSYSAFDYGDVQVSTPSVGVAERVSLSVDVTNTSGRDADEVVQLYLHDPFARVSRPGRQLRGFARVSIPAGETRTVEFDVDPAQMAIWDGGAWHIEPGRIDVMIGASSADIRATGSFEISGSATTDRTPAAIETRVTVR
jgi:beta-glucosidase